MGKSIPATLRPAISAPGLVWTLLAAGRWKGHWKPSPRLRAAGWTNLDLGTDVDAAIAAVMTRNREVAAWEQGAAETTGARAAPVRLRTVGDVVHDWIASPAFAALAATTRRNYRSHSNRVLEWAENGRTPVAHVTRQVVIDLRDALVATGTNRARTAGLLAVLRIVLQHAVDRGAIAVNPALKIRIPQPATRKVIVRAEAMELLIDTAREMGLHGVALGVVLGFWTMQREGDLLAYTDADWRPLPKEDVPPEALATLVAGDGHVWGFRRLQSKVREWVDAPVPHDVRALVEEQRRRNRARDVPVMSIIADDRLARAYPAKQFQRRFADVRDAAAAAAEARGDTDLAAHIAGVQFRDLRRTGMCYFGELRVPVALIASISGHSIDYTQRILDTYMPANTRFAIMAVAEAVHRAAERAAIVQENEG